MKKARQYGLYTGLIFSAGLFLLSVRTQTDPVVALNYSFLSCFPFLIFFILMAMLNRRKELGNHIDFSEAFKTGLGVAAIAGVLFALANFVYLQWINHDLVLQIAENNRQQMLAEHKSVEEVGDRIVTYINMAPFSFATIRLVSVIFIGGIISIVLALIVKRKHIEVLTETE